MNHIELFVARHGETEYNRKGLLQGRGINAPLNETGKRQAASLAKYLCNYPADLIVSSSMTRAWQTAEFYRRERQLRILKNPDLDEMDFGKFEGKDYASAARELDQLGASWKKGDLALSIPGGESPHDVFERANRAVSSYLEDMNRGTLVLFIHGRLIRILLSEWLGLGLRNMDKIEHQNGAVNRLRFKNGTFEAVYLNKTDHLYPDSV